MSHETPEPIKTCSTCKYKATAGAMVDPCFPCLHDRSIWTGEPKQKYDAWTDEKLSWEEIAKENAEREAEIAKFFDDHPEILEDFRKLIKMPKSP